jgi:hypothetical protein
MREIIRHSLYEYLENLSKNGDLLIFEGYSSDEEKIVSLIRKIEKNLIIAYKDVTGSDLNLPKIEVKIDPNIKNGKIAGFNHPDYNGDNGILGVKPKALNNMEYLKDVITHELIHAAVGEDLPKHREHGGLFKKLAEKMGLPIERRD